ncbi:hypothetical protein BVX97_04285 [bacterium E08(2017)]|nr:hypothetical protein BVX97_04285 [bacterium E08(2017)]
MISKDPKASFIIPVYNRAETVRVAIDSALNQQTDIPYELLVVDDGSDDSTADAVKKYGNKIRLIQKDNGGAGSARNAGVKASESEIMVFLDSDDSATPSRIEKQVGYMMSQQDIGATFGGVLLEGSKSDSFVEDDFSRIEDFLGRLIGAEEGPMLWNASSAIRKEAYIDAGMQNEDMRCGEDFDFWCRAARRMNASYSKEIFTVVGRGGSDHISSSTEAYSQKVITLTKNYQSYGPELSDEKRRRAHRNILRAINSLLRNEWANGDRKAYDTLTSYSHLMPMYSKCLWRVILSLFPGSAGGILRSAIRQHRAKRYE